MFYVFFNIIDSTIVVQSKELIVIIYLLDVVYKVLGSSTGRHNPLHGSLRLIQP